MFVFLLFHPSSNPSPPAAHLRKSSSILGNGEKSELGLVATGTEQRLSWGKNRVPTGGFSFPVNIQIMLVFGSGGREIARERKEKGAGAGKVRVLVF